MPTALTHTLPDARLLGYDDVGDEDGHPVLFFHGVPGSRRYWRIAGPPDALPATRTRLIAFDRTGIGKSTRHDERSYLSTAKDAASLADAIGLNSFSLVGYSGGCAYALAAAAILAERVESVALIAPVADLSIERLRMSLDPSARRGIALAHHLSPRKVAELADRLGPERMLTMGTERVWSMLPAADRRALARARVEQQAQLMLREAVRHGLEGALHDLRLLTEPWGFDLADARAPVTIFAGGADPWSTPDMVHWLEVGLPDCRTVGYPSGGHFTALIEHFDVVLAAVASRASQPVPA